MKNMKNIFLDFSPQLNFQRRFIFFFFDLISFSFSLFLSFLIRFEFDFAKAFPRDFYFFLILFLSVKFIIFSLNHLYNISWRYVSLQDLSSLAKSSIFSNSILFVILYGFNIEMFTGFPRTVLFIDFLLTFFLTSAFRISKRFFVEVLKKSVGNSTLKRTLIIGAGSSGEQLLREVYRSDPRLFNPIGFIDDDEDKQGMQIQGVRVIGTSREMEYVINHQNISAIIIAIPSADRNFYKKIYKLAKENNVTDVKIVSTVNDVSNVIQVNVQDIRDLNVSDLIGRQAVSINTKDIIGYLKNKKILITGAAGSIGSEIARQVAYYEPAEIGILDNNESDLAELEIQLSRNWKHTPVNMLLCDISNSDKVDKIISEYQPGVIFHAAAYKHVPVMENFPEEAIRVNVLGTYNLVTAAKKYNISNFVLISTDKAVNPTSIMGGSKRIAEYIVTGLGAESNSRFVAVRFGNVIGSRGSALPIFIDQLKNGGPITVTHPDMKRYFMTIPEAVALVLQASATGKNGDVFVLDMGEPIKILNLVHELITLNNLIPNKDIKIEFTGIRPGEKLFEEILTAEEGVINTSHEKIFKAKMVCTHDKEQVEDMVRLFSEMLFTASKEDWLSVLKYYIPTFNENSCPSAGGNTIDELLNGISVPIKKTK